MNKLVQEARALCEGATKGPWTASLCEWDCDCENFYSRKGSCDMEPDKCGHGRIINGAFVTETKTVEYGGEFCDMNDADAKLCARSRTLIPEMADEIERLEAAEKERDALIAAIRDKDACRTCVHRLKDGCSAVRNGWRCRYVHPSESGPQEGANQ